MECVDLTPKLPSEDCATGRCGVELHTIVCSSYTSPGRRQKGKKGMSVRVACLLSALLEGFVTLDLGPRSESDAWDTPGCRFFERSLRPAARPRDRRPIGPKVPPGRRDTLYRVAWVGKRSGGGDLKRCRTRRVTNPKPDSPEVSENLYPGGGALEGRKRGSVGSPLTCRHLG